MSTYFILVTLFTVLIRYGACSGSGGPCYSASQTKCQHAWNNLWKANMERQMNKICQYFEDVHTCTMDYKATCSFKPQEDDLYQTDIVQTYTRKPYSCTLMGGNIQYKGDNDENSGSRSQQSVNLMMFLVLISTLTDRLC